MKFKLNIYIYIRSKLEFVIWLAIKGVATLFWEETSFFACVRSILINLNF